MISGSGSSKEEIAEAVSHGVVKMNVDTDTQWAYWNGLRAYEKEKHDYLQGQIGNPKGPEAPNKKFYVNRIFCVVFLLYVTILSCFFVFLPHRILVCG